MSDEPTPLRLKPRLKADTPAGTPAPEEPAAAAPAGGEETPKIRLRPKLSIASEPAPAPAAEPEPEPEPAPELAEPAPVEELPPEETPVAEAPIEEPPPPPPDPTAGGAFPKFKLKFKAAGSAAAPPEAAPEAAPSEEAPAELPPADEANPELGSTVEGEPEAAAETEAYPAKPKVMQLRLSEDQLPPLEPGEVKIPKAAVPRKAITAGVIGAVAAFLIIFGGSAYFTHLLRKIPEAPEAKPVVVLPPPKPVEAVPDEAAVAEAAAKAAAAAAAKAKKALPPPPKVVIAPAAATTNLGGGMSATTNDDVAATDASPAFRSWVASAKIGGVFQGASPRVLINGRTVRVGTTVDDGLGIIFDSVDVESKMIIFKDSTGAVVSRRY